MSISFRYMEVCQQSGPDITEQSISFESNYVFKNLQLQDLDFTLVNSPSATVAKGGSACESPQSQSVFTLNLCNQRNIRHLTDHRLIAS